MPAGRQVRHETSLIFTARRRIGIEKWVTWIGSSSALWPVVHTSTHSSEPSGASWSTVKVLHRTGPQRHIITQIEQAGVNSLFIVGMVSFLVGTTLVLQTVFVLSAWGQRDLVGGMVGVTMVRALGPLITAVIFTGRVGAAYTAEVGTMKVSEEVLALQTMGINPIGYLVAPRFIATLAVIPALTVLANFIGIFGGYIVGTQQFGLDPDTYIEMTKVFLTERDFVFGIVKGTLFGMLITTICCYKGFIVEGGGTEVGRATMEAVVISLVGIIFFDMVFTLAYNLWFR